MDIGLSRKLAIVLGTITPVLETVRRWHTWTDFPPAMLDDYFLGGFLLYGAWRVGKDANSGQRYLTAAWGVALGMVFLSFFGQIDAIRKGVADPAPVPSQWVAIVKGIGFVLVIVGLAASLRKLPVES